MELEDSLFPLLREVRIGIDPYDVFRDAEWALLIGAKPRGPGLERADLLDINGQIFAEQVCMLKYLYFFLVAKLVTQVSFTYTFLSTYHCREKHSTL